MVAALRPPLGRTLLVSKLDAEATYCGRSYSLFCNEFADGTVDPHGYEHFAAFELDGLIPVWRVSFSDCPPRSSTVDGARAQTTYVTYSLLRSTAPVVLSVTPLCAYREFHSNGHGGFNPDVSPVRGGFEIRAFDDAHPYRIITDRGELDVQPDWYWHFKHRLEAQRGLDDQEDLFRPGAFRAELEKEDTLTLVCTSESNKPVGGKAAYASERERERALVQNCPPDEQFRKRLTLAADQFVVRRGTGSERGATIIAGYPWFGTGAATR